MKQTLIVFKKQTMDTENRTGYGCGLLFNLILLLWMTHCLLHYLLVKLKS